MDNTIVDKKNFDPLHIKYFEDRYILPQDAWEAGFRSLSCNDWEHLKQSVPNLPHPGGRQGPSGLLVWYPPTIDGKQHVRVRPDLSYWYRDTVDGKGEKVEIDAKWLANGGGVVPLITPRALADRDGAIVIVEAPPKALALVHAGYPAIGMGGVEAGGHVTDAVTPTLHPELAARIDWRGRVAIILFDANIGHKTGVGRGAARLAAALGASGAIVRVAFLPLVNAHDQADKPLEEVLEAAASPVKGNDFGPDDYLASRGPDAMAAVLWAAVAADPCDRVRETVARVSGKKEQLDAVLSLLGELFLQATLKVGGSAKIDALFALVKPLGITKKTLKEAVGIFEAKVASKTKDETPEWMHLLRRAGNEGPVISCIDNAITILSHDPAWCGVLAFNAFSQQVVKKKKPPFSAEAGESPIGPWADDDDVRLVDYLGRVCGITLGPEKVAAAANVVARKFAFHPMQDDIRAVPWDGTRRLDTWLPDCLGVEATPYTRLVGRFFCMQLVARIFRPGCKADYVLILESEEQGLRKSSIASELLPNREGFSETPFEIGTKDAYTALRGKALIELAEVSTLMRTESHAAKAFFSNSTDRYRPPYGHRDIDVPRSCVFVGTINPEGTGYFKDKTGNRRYWPVVVPGHVDIEKIRAVRAQLLAEALARIDDPDPEVSRYWPSEGEEREHFRGEQAEREEEHPWETKIAEGVSTLNETTIDYVFENILDIKADKRTQGQQNAVATILKRLGFARKVAKERDEETGKRKSVKVYRRTDPLPEPSPLVLDEFARQAVESFGFAVS